VLNIATFTAAEGEGANRHDEVGGGRFRRKQRLGMGLTRQTGNL
jgi:hypothetical protein